MARVLSIPFRLLANGVVATVEQDTDEGNRQELLNIAMTRKGERALITEYGMTDPTFNNDVDIADLASQVEQYGPAITITEVRWEYVDESTSELYIEWTDEDVETEELIAEDTDDVEL